MIGAADPGYAADPALYQAARREGEVVWYTALIVNQAVRPLIEAFNKKYPGIEVHYARADSGPTAIKVMTEARAGKVQSDVFDGIDATPPLVQAGLVEPFVPSEADRYPPELKDPSGYWNALVVYFLTPAINTDLVPPRRGPRTRERPARSAMEGQDRVEHGTLLGRRRLCRLGAGHHGRARAAWVSCARSAGKASSISTPPTGPSSIR